MAIPQISKHSPCMAKLDKLHWEAGMSFFAYGVLMGVRVSRADVLPALRDLLPPGSEPVEATEVQELISFEVGGPGPRPGINRYHLVYAGVGRLGRTHEMEEALHAIEASGQLLVAMSAPQNTFIHAGAVGWRGKAILLPGKSFAGKSTLVAELLKRGAEYYSDEFAVLDAAGRVHAYPRRLSLRHGDTAVRQRATAEELGATTARTPLPVGMVALTNYREGSRWTPRRIVGSKAVLGMFDNAVAARKSPARCLHDIERSLAKAERVAGPRGEAAETAELILSACCW